MNPNLKYAMLLTICLGVSTGGCNQKPDQFGVEYDTAGFFLSRIQSYEISLPGVKITNMQQVVEGVGLPYPSSWHHRLKEFGSNAGFKNSLYEKYVFPSLQLSNENIGGEIVILSGQPFPDSGGQMGRIVFSKHGTTSSDWTFKFYPEGKVTAIFSAANQAIPRNQEMPTPASLVEKYDPPSGPALQQFFAKKSSNLGIGRGSWWIVMLGYMFAFGLMLFLAYLLFIHRGQK